MEHFVNSVAPAGAVWSTALDVAEYVRLELSGGQSAKGEHLLSRQTLQSRWRGGIKITDKLGYGLGLMHAEENGLEVISHGGGTLGSTSDMYFLPAHNLGVVVLTNMRAANYFLSAVRLRIMEIVFGAERRSEQILGAAQKALRESGAAGRERTATGQAAADWLRQFTGDYYSGELGPARIVAGHGEYRAIFESWESPLGVEARPGGERLISILGPPWSGSLHLRPVAGGLLLDAGQDKYQFSRC